MPTQVSHITEQTDCIYLTVDQGAPLEEVLAEAREIATRTQKMVQFAIYSYAAVFQVTSESVIEDMILKYNDRFFCGMIIT